MPSDSPVGTAEHYGLTVSDLDECVAFYRDVLGFEVESRFHNSGEPIEAAVGLAGVELDGAFLDAGTIRIELLEYTPSVDSVQRVPNAPGNAHLCVSVDDITEAYERLRPDVEFVSLPQTLESGVQIAYLRDPEGNVVELIDRG